MRLSSIVRRVEDATLNTSRKLRFAASDFNQAVKAEYVRRREQRIIEQVEIQARAQVLASKILLRELERETALDEADT
jgi:hypothetical protein